MLTSQRGQALVGVMVVMVILFALAGAVAIGASTLLASRRNAGATNDDFRLRSAVNDSVAQVSGTTGACSAVPPPSPLPTPTPSTIPASLQLALPSPDSQDHLVTRCVRMDGVASDGVKRLAVPPPGGNGNCRTLDLDPGKTGPLRVGVVLDVFLSGNGWAFLTGDGTPPLTSCPATMPATKSSCATTFSLQGAPPQTGAMWSQVALSCNIPDGEHPQLRIKGFPTSPRQLFFAQQNTPGASSLGSVYLLGVQTPLANSPDEEALLFVGADRSNRYLYEAPLQS